MEIKFRVWDTLQHKLLVPDYIEFLNGEPYWVDISDGDDGFQDDGDPQSMQLEQYTSLKDRNGKEIYVGDIVRSTYKYAQPKVSQVFVENGNSYIAGEDLATGGDMMVSDHAGEIEVIGNVHDNPELLETGNDRH